MRKHKSVVAILLAVMMIFTFMPTMSFAATGDATWSTDYKTVTFEGYSGTYNATWTSAGTAGVTKASATTTDGQHTGEAYFIDLADAAITSPAITKGQNLSATAYNALLNSAAEVTVTAKNAKGSGVITAWTAKLTGEEVDAKTLTTNVEKTLTVAFTKAAATSGTTPDMDGTSVDKPVLVNAPLTISVNVVPDAAAVVDPVQNAMFIGEDSYAITNGVVTVPYNGSTQTLTVKDATNYTESYQKYDPSTGKWSAVDAIEVKDVAEYDTFRGVYTPATGNAVVYTDEFTVAVTPASGAGFGFDTDGDAGVREYNVAEGEEYDAYDFINVEAGYMNYRYSNGQRTWIENGYVTSNSDSDKAAVKADAETLKAYFADRYEIKKSSTKAAPLVVNLTIEDKYADMTADEKTAFDKKYEQLEKNYAKTFTSGNGWNTRSYTAVELVLRNNDTTGTVNIIPATVVQKEDDVTITFAPNKTFKAKKKTKKLAANKSFTLQAEAESGKAVQWIITKGNKKITIDKETGKITVKKGLKKGTYSVKVKAKTVADAAYKAAKDTVTIKVKVK